MSFAAARRTLTPELMDIEPVGTDELARCLADLAQVNRLTRAAAPTLGFLARATRGANQFSLADIGCGDGGMLRRIAAWAQRNGKAVQLYGLDINPAATAVARALTPADAPISFVTSDLFAWAPARAPDFITSALFAHHLDDDELVRFLRWMEATATRGWFINDLHRHWLAYHGFRLMSRAARWHRFVRHDGPVSVARSFVPADWHLLLTAAGIAPESVSIRWHTPFRLCVGRIR